MCQHRGWNLRVTGDPTDISHAGEFILGVDIEDVLEGQGSFEKVTTSGVNDTLWLASGSGGPMRAGGKSIEGKRRPSTMTEQVGGRVRWQHPAENPSKEHWEAIRNIHWLRPPL